MCHYSHYSTMWHLENFNGDDADLCCCRRGPSTRCILRSFRTTETAVSRHLRSAACSASRQTASDLLQPHITSTLSQDRTANVAYSKFQLRRRYTSSFPHPLQSLPSVTRLSFPSLVMPFSPHSCLSTLPFLALYIQLQGVGSVSSVSRLGRSSTEKMYFGASEVKMLHLANDNFQRFL